jgi:predicted flap endonuclease-1-like 5' DNA nuclease
MPSAPSIVSLQARRSPPPLRLALLDHQRSARASRFKAGGRDRAGHQSTIQGDKDVAKLTEIEGIGEAYAAKLAEAGIASLESLLTTCSQKSGRKETAEKTGISEKLLLGWANRADLSRIKGVSTQYADLLECAGVDTVPELAQRNAANLHARMAEVNEEKKLVRQVPGLAQVEDWVGQAKDLPRVITH